MKAKNILMSVLLAMGFIAAKAAGYPPELALVSQPVLVYNYNSITVYYDVQNIGDYTYRGNIYLYLDPDNGYYYAEKYVRVCPGRIKRVAVEIPAYRPNPYRTYTIMPYYSMDNELYSFTTFEYFEPLSFYWNGPRTERWVVVNVPPRPRYYYRPGDYRYYYDGYRPPMPPPPAMGYGPATPPPPLNPMHHTYNYHTNNGGYPAINGLHNDNPPMPNEGGTAPTATVRPKPNAGSMSSHSSGSSGTSNGTTTSGSNSGRPESGSNVSRPSSSGTSNGTTTSGSNSGRPESGSNVSRPSSSGTSNGTTTSGSNSGRPASGSNVSRPSSSGTSNGTTTSGSSSGRTGNGSNVSRPSSSGTSNGTTTSGSSSGRSNSGSNVRSGSNGGNASSTSGTTNSSSRSGNSSSRSRR